MYYRKKYEQAVKLLTEALKINPENSDALFFRGMSRFDSQNDISAIKV